jgi:hypothetical protein
MLDFRRTSIIDYIDVDSDLFVESRAVRYCDGYKYQTRKPVVFKTDIRPAADCVTDLVLLRRDGTLIVDKYFAWDGASGPTWDAKTNMRGTLGHDARYYLIRIGGLDIKWKEHADRLLERCMIEDGAWPIRARYYYWAVRCFGRRFCLPESVRKILRAPKKKS